MCLTQRHSFFSVILKVKNNKQRFSDVSTYCLQCVYSLKSVYCWKILIFIWKWNNHQWALSTRAAVPQLEPEGILSGLIVRSAYARSELTPHARQSKARLRGPFWMNSLAGPQRTETCLLSAATHSRFCPPPQSCDHAQLIKDQIHFFFCRCVALMEVVLFMWTVSLWL